MAYDGTNPVYARQMLWESFSYALSATDTVRDRDSLAQERLAIDGLAAEMARRLAAPWTSPKDAT